MTDISRRSFLRGTLSVVGATAVSQFVGPSLPVLYGDGVRDDAAALNALFSGKPILVEGSGITAKSGMLSGGRFALSSIMKFRNCDGWVLRDCYFQAMPGFKGSNIISVDGSNSNLLFDSITLDISNVVQDLAWLDAGGDDDGFWLHSGLGTRERPIASYRNVSSFN